MRELPGGCVMPVTPLHIWPAAALKNPWPFIYANVLIDFEPIYIALSGAHVPLHGIFHTWLGALCVALAVWGCSLGWAWGLGALFGAVCHLVLDGFMHSDVLPWMPKDIALVNLVSLILTAVTLPFIGRSCRAAGAWRPQRIWPVFALLIGWFVALLESNYWLAVGVT